SLEFLSDFRYIFPFTHQSNHALMPFLMKGYPMKTNTRHLAGITAGILSLAGYASAATLGSEKYTYDASGNIIEKSIDGVVTKMTYDKSNRLTEFQTAGQGKETTAYDNASRPVTERNADGQTTRSLSYGYGDKVLETRNQDSKAGFYYNAAGQLVGKKTHGNVSTYTWDGNVLAAEGSVAFANEAHLSGGVPVLAGKDVVVSDYLGNTLSSAEEQFSGTSYGEGLEPGRFTGKKFVKELASFVFPYRLYSSNSNSWTTLDPAGYPDGINNYVFVGSNPVCNYDVLGLEWSPFVDKFAAPQPPPNVEDSYAQPSYNGHYGDLGYTEGRKWEHQNWEDMTRGCDYIIYGGPGQKLIGGFSITQTSAFSFTINAQLISGQIGVQTASGTSNGVDEAALITEQLKANLRISKANIYNMTQVWLCDSSNNWNALYDSQWVSNEKTGELFKNHSNAHILISTEQ
ncbi:MAG: hypothetical protein NTV46_03265, partial [Verrucomicrobia bacterium]|nr:hypothetical protein [Verrucomicrobiota bacterium]